jgi:hypothetical protein
MRLGTAPSSVKVYPQPELRPVPVYRPQVERYGPKTPPPPVEPAVPLWKLLRGPEAVGELFERGGDLAVKFPEIGIA